MTDVVCPECGAVVDEIDDEIDEEIYCNNICPECGYDPAEDEYREDYEDE